MKNERPRSLLRGIKRPTSLCSVLACCAAELRGIKPYFGLKPDDYGINTTSLLSGLSISVITIYMEE